MCVACFICVQKETEGAQRADRGANRHKNGRGRVPNMTWSEGDETRQELCQDYFRCVVNVKTRMEQDKMATRVL